jgi:hypothetical protein
MLTKVGMGREERRRQEKRGVEKKKICGFLVWMGREERRGKK